MQRRTQGKTKVSPESLFTNSRDLGMDVYPKSVLVASLIFIASVVMLHLLGKLKN